jgi:hypothetical protein
MPLNIDLPKHLLTGMSSPHAKAYELANADRQVHLNSLALYAADWYLQCLQFETQREDRADWWIQYLSRAATLEIIGIGKLECVPVTGDTVTVTISPDLQADRIGYLFIKLDEFLSSAQIVGFVPKYSETVRLDRVQSTDRLIDYLCDLEAKPVIHPVVDLGKWAEGIFDDLWQNIAGLSLTPAYRNSRDLLSVKSTGGGRQVKLGNLPQSPSVILTVDYKQIDNVNFDLYLQVHPEIPETKLPMGLKFSALDDLGAEIGSVQTMTGDLAGEIVLEHGKKGEVFSIEIEFEGFKNSESFKI